MIEALIELITAAILDHIFELAKAPYRCLPIYGVIDLGFRHDNAYERNGRAVLLLRQAHFRPKDNIELPSNLSERQSHIRTIETLLNKFYITSTSPETTLYISEADGQLIGKKGDQELGWLSPAHITRLLDEFGAEAPAQFRTPNIQLTRIETQKSAQTTLVDFSQYCFTDFKEPYYLSIPASDRPMNFGSVHSIDAEHTDESELYDHLCSLGMFEGEEPNQAILDHFSYFNPEISMSKIVRFAHDLGCEYEVEETMVSHMDRKIKQFVERIFPKEITQEFSSRT